MLPSSFNRCLDELVDRQPSAARPASTAKGADSKILFMARALSFRRIQNGRLSILASRSPLP